MNHSYAEKTEPCTATTERYPTRRIRAGYGLRPQRIDDFRIDRTQMEITLRKGHFDFEPPERRIDGEADVAGYATSVSFER